MRCGKGRKVYAPHPPTSPVLSTPDKRILARHTETDIACVTLGQYLWHRRRRNFYQIDASKGFRRIPRKPSIFCTLCNENWANDRTSTDSPSSRSAREWHRFSKFGITRPKCSFSSKSKHNAVIKARKGVYNEFKVNTHNKGTNKESGRKLIQHPEPILQTHFD